MPRYISPNDPLPILRISLYLSLTRNSDLELPLVPGAALTAGGALVLAILIVPNGQTLSKKPKVFHELDSYRRINYYNISNGWLLKEQ